MEKRINPYTDYEGRPEFILRNGFKIQNPGDPIINILDHEGRIHLKVEKSNFFDLLFPTMKGLIVDLAHGSEMAESFQKDWEPYQDAENDVINSYGVLVYYPHRKHVVRLAPPFWHRLALMVRNSTLLLNPDMRMKWKDVRKIFDDAVPAFAGCSLGSRCAEATVYNLRPQHIKVADFDSVDLNNCNRLRMTYSDLGRNKAVVTAEQFNAIDPFLRISVFDEGIHLKNISDFLEGNPSLNEPPATIVIEETDNPDIKILIRQKARELGIPVLTVTDIGSGAQRDFLEYDKDKKLSLTLGVSDRALLIAQEKCRNNPSLDNFFKFAFKLIGHRYMQMPEFRRMVQSISTNNPPPEFGGVYQLGSTAMVAGGFAGEAVARYLLGYKLQKRIFVDITRKIDTKNGRRKS